MWNYQTAMVMFGTKNTHYNILYKSKIRDCEHNLSWYLMIHTYQSTIAGADPGEVKWVNFHPPFLSPLLLFFSLIPQILKQYLISLTLIQKFTPISKSWICPCIAWFLITTGPQLRVLVFYYLMCIFAVQILLYDWQTCLWFFQVIFTFK